MWDGKRGPDPIDVQLAALEADVAALASEPHPMGSEAARRARDRLLKALADLGLEATIQRTRVDYQHPARSSANPRVAWVENIVAELPGSPGSGTALLMSHYDSVWQGPGAGDAASGVAAVLAAARAALEMPDRSNSFVFLMTDGEEMGLFGAQGFFRQHPLADDVDLVVNFEARGNQGPPQMFQTSGGNRWLIQMLGEGAASPVANSLSFEVYKRMPNDTDMTISLGEGIAGLNFAFIGGFPNYHAATDNPEMLSSRSLAQQASNAVALTRQLANADLSKARDSDDLTYFNLSSRLFLHYPMFVVWLLMGLTVAAVLVGLRLARMRHLVSWKSIAAAFAVLLALLLNVSNLFESISDIQFRGGWRDAGFWQNFHLYELNFVGGVLITAGGALWLARRLSYAVPWVWLTLFLAVQLALGFVAGRPVPVALAALVTLLLLLPARRGLPPLAWLAASGLLWGILGVAALLALPHASYLAVAMALPCGLLLMSARSAEGGDRINPWLGLSWIPALLLMPVLVYGLYLGLGTFMPQLPLGLLALLTAAILIPLAPARSPLSSALLAGGLAVLITAQLQFSFTASQRQPGELFVLTDTASGTSWWGSRDPEPPGFSKQQMANAEQVPLSTLIPGARSSWWRGEEVASLDAAGPVFEQAAEQRASDTLTLIASAPAARASLYFDPPSALAQVRVDGQPVSGSDMTSLRLFAMPAGTTVEIDRNAGSELTIHWRTAQPGMPAQAPVRPVSSMPTPGTWSDTRMWSGRTAFP